MGICRNVQLLEGYVPGEQPKDDGRIVKLNTNENPYPPSPKVGEALAAFDWRKLRLYPDPVFKEVRARIAEINRCKPEQVFVGNGSDETLSLFVKAFVEVPDGTLGYFDPTYSLYPVLAEIRDCRKRPVALNGDFSWNMPADYTASAFVITNPNAPTGVPFPVKTVAEFAASFSGIVLVDEAYADFADANCMELAASEANTNVLVSRTLSKSFSLAGLRFGYCVGPENLIAALYKIKDSYNMDWFSQILGKAALDDLPYMRENVHKIRATRERIAKELRKRGWNVPDSQTNFLFAKPPAGDAERIFNALKQEGVYVRWFSAPNTRDRLRITIGTDAQMDRFLAVLYKVEKR